MKDTPRELMKNRMWKKHLFWLIPICIVFGIIIGFLLGYEDAYNKFIGVVRCVN